jgi:hypothetical protein
MAGSAVHRQATVLRFLRKRRMTRHALALAIGRETGYVNKVLRGLVPSEPVWREIAAYMKSPDRYKPPSIRSRRQAEAIAKARSILRRAGYLKEATG